MGNESNLLEKTRILADAYQRITDEGRDVLDKVVQKLEEFNGKSEKITNFNDETLIAMLKRIKGDMKF